VEGLTVAVSAAATVAAVAAAITTAPSTSTVVAIPIPTLAFAALVLVADDTTADTARDGTDGGTGTCTTGEAADDGTTRRAECRT